MSVLSKFCLASTLFVGAVSASAQAFTDLGQRSLARWNIGAANYSGIAQIGDARYALVSDKEPTDGFFTMRIDQNATTGEIVDAYLEGFKGNPAPTHDAAGNTIRDCEGIAFVPASRTIFISGEGDQKILEYTLEGLPTGRELNVPAIFSRQNIVSNYGFEALAYEPSLHRFWTTTESTLPRDGNCASAAHPGVANVLRIQSFTDDLQPAAQYAYRMDAGRTEKFGSIYAFGVSEMLALPNGHLLVLERETNVPSGYLGAECVCKIFDVCPAESHQIDSSTELSRLDPNHFMIKRLVATWTTKLNATRRNFSNYEGMTLGARLADGRQTILVVSDSQGGYGRGPIHLKDNVRVLIMPK